MPWCATEQTLSLNYNTCLCVCLSVLDVDVLDESLVESSRHAVFDSLLVVSRRSPPAAVSPATVSPAAVSLSQSSRRVTDLLLALPLLTCVVSAAREFWRLSKSRGHVASHRLLTEMVDRILTD